MKSRYLSLFILLFSTLILATPRHVENQLIYRTKDPGFFARILGSGRSASVIIGAKGGQKKQLSLGKPSTLSLSSRSSDNTDTYLWDLPEGTDLDLAEEELLKGSNVGWVQKNYLYELTYIPDDTDIAKQWYLDSVNAYGAWDYTTGSEDVVIAIIDSGVQLDHPDLVGNLWTNPLINSGVDSDGNEYDQDLNGWDFGDNDNNPSDSYNHGTSVAGMAAAQTDNGTGIAGIAFQATILPVKVMNKNLEMTSLTISSGVHYAIEKAVDVINLSLGGAISGDYLMAKSIAAAIEADIIVVAAAGNVSGGDSSNIDDIGYVPATYPDVLTVSGSDDSGNFDAELSYYGESVDIMAPGRSVYTTSYEASYVVTSGTSFSSPLVAGAAALLKAYSPGASRAEIVSALTLSATDKGPNGYDIYSGYGLLNIEKALSYIDHGPIIKFDAALSTYFSRDKAIDVSITDTQGVSENSLEMSAQLSGSSTVTSLNITDDSLSFNGETLTLAASFLDTLPDPAGTVIFKVKAADISGEISEKTLTLTELSSFKLFGPYGSNSPILNAPNPFDPTQEKTYFSFEMTQEADIEIDLYALNLHRVQSIYNGTLAAGYHDDLYWNGRDESGDIVPNGVYILIAKAECDGETIIKRQRVAVLRK